MAKFSTTFLFLISLGATNTINANDWICFDYPLKNTSGEFYVTESNDDGDGYYNSQDFGVNNHLGEDWNGDRGGNSDCDDPVYAISDGTVIYSDDAGSTWGNAIIIRHTLADGSEYESQYSHLNNRNVFVGGDTLQNQQIGTIGDGGGVCGDGSPWLAHLHFEIRNQSSSSWGFPGTGYGDTTGWEDPSDWIDNHRCSRLANNSNSYLDIDGNGTVDALSDGLLLIRYFFGFSGLNLTSGVISPDAIRSDPSQIEMYINELMVLRPYLSDNFEIYFDSTKPYLLNNNLIFDGVRISGLGFSIMDALNLKYIFDKKTLSFQLDTNTIIEYQNVGVFYKNNMAIDVEPKQPEYLVNGLIHQFTQTYNFEATSTQPFVAELNLKTGHVISWLIENQSNEYSASFI